MPYTKNTALMTKMVMLASCENELKSNIVSCPCPWDLLGMA